MCIYVEQLQQTSSQNGHLTFHVLNAFLRTNFLTGPTLFGHEVDHGVQLTVPEQVSHLGAAVEG